MCHHLPVVVKTGVGDDSFHHHLDAWEITELVRNPQLVCEVVISYRVLVECLLLPTFPNVGQDFQQVIVVSYDQDLTEQRLVDFVLGFDGLRVNDEQQDVHGGGVDVGDHNLPPRLSGVGNR